MKSQSIVLIDRSRGTGNPALKEFDEPSGFPSEFTLAEPGREGRAFITLLTRAALLSIGIPVVCQGIFLIVSHTGFCKVCTEKYLKSCTTITDIF
jgi:hypothetical protein